jgi:hypothetical protein
VLTEQAQIVCWRSGWRRVAREAAVVVLFNAAAGCWLPWAAWPVAVALAAAQVSVPGAIHTLSLPAQGAARPAGFVWMTANVVVFGENWWWRRCLYRGEVDEATFARLRRELKASQDIG